MSGQKLNVLRLMIVCWLTGEITCSQPTTSKIEATLTDPCVVNSASLSPVKILLVIPKKNEMFDMEVTLNVSSKTLNFNLSKYNNNNNNNYEIRMNEIDLQPFFLSDQCKCPDFLQLAESTLKYALTCLTDILSICPNDVSQDCWKNSVDPQETCRNATYVKSKCTKKSSRYILNLNNERRNMKKWRCVDCGNKQATACKSGNKTACVIKPESTLNLTKPESGKSGHTDPSNASEALDNLKPQTEWMKKNNKTSVAIVMDDTVGVLHIPDENSESDFCYSSNQNMMNMADCESDLSADFPWSVMIPSEAFDKSRLETNESAFVGILRFHNMGNEKATTNYTILNNETYGITMGANISNLTYNIEMSFKHSDLVGNAHCSSWDGKGKLEWTTFGCETEKINNDTIKCSCSHLTFFAVLMSPNTDSNTVAPYLESLTLISSIGCGISVFFLAIALFMHFLLQKAKSNQATKILINMFVALFLLNVSFLSNESVANTEDKAACVFIALLMHYSMLATFTWFFIQALHMYLWLIRQNVTITNYMRNITVLGWVCSAPVVIVVVSIGGYNTVSFSASSGKIARMCWITDPFIHYIVNTGYYIFVFIFTLGIFITILSRIVQVRHIRATDGKRQTFRKQLMMVLSLFLLFGLTWAVAFFSYGPMLIPSYYIFSVLNSFQGFFLFLYYYYIHKDVEGRFSDDPRSSGSTTTIVPPNINAAENVYNEAH